MKLHYEPYHVSKEGSSGMKTEIVVCPFLKNSLYLRNFRGPCQKKIFFRFFFLNSCENLQVRPQRACFKAHPVLSSEVMPACSGEVKFSGGGIGQGVKKKF